MPQETDEIIEAVPVSPTPPLRHGESPPLLGPRSTGRSPQTEASFSADRAPMVDAPLVDLPGSETLAVDAPVVDAPPVRLFEAEAIYSAEAIEERVEIVIERSWLGRTRDRVGSALEWLFGLASLFVGLAVLATFPVVQLLSLGYLLEASGRVARSGRLRDGFVGVRKAARVGGVVLGAWLTFWPLRLVADLSYSSWLIEPAGSAAVRWRVALVLLTAVMVWHLGWACFRGGRLRHFLWPAPIAFVRRWWRGGMYGEARDRLAEFIASLHLTHYLSLGARGFAGAAAWLVLPVLLLIASFRLPDGPAALCGLLGLVSLPLVALYLPFLQAQFACENRLVAMFDVGRVRQAFRRAPLAFWFALLVLLAFALPPFLLKIEFVEREIAGVESLVFVALIAPARLLAGWALGRGRQRALPRFFLVRWFSRLGMLPLAIVYAVVVSLSRYTSWYGSWSLFEQHAFLLPAPFLGL